MLRSYRGNQQSDSLLEFQPDAARLAIHGFQPTSQSWAAGQWGGDAFAISIVVMVILLLFSIPLFVLAGIVILLFLVTAKPAGTLTVIYAREFAIPGLTAAGDTNSAGQLPSSAPRLADHLRELKAARDSGDLTDGEYAKKRAEVISRY